MKQLIIITITFLLSLNSCSKIQGDKSLKIPEYEDYIIFGNTYGECTGDCRSLFLLTDKDLYEDSNNPLHEEVTFNCKALSNQKRKIADTLFVLPLSLRTNSFNQDELLQIISDFDYIINGNINGVEFWMRYDDIDSTKNYELYQYSQTLRGVLNEIK